MNDIITLAVFAGFFAAGSFATWAAGRLFPHKPSQDQRDRCTRRMARYRQNRVRLAFYWFQKGAQARQSNN